jgi:hypothetical protein
MGANCGATETLHVGVAVIDGVAVGVASGVGVEVDVAPGVKVTSDAIVVPIHAGAWRVAVAVTKGGGVAISASPKRLLSVKNAAPAPKAITATMSNIAHQSQPRPGVGAGCVEVGGSSSGIKSKGSC